ncbi:MAG: large conductance mechanosensitive channel protein MscL [Bacteroidia bacterium]|nr:large conductance mechanosensitive channel protein MscL [Bacteroidia bacterium]
MSFIKEFREFAMKGNVIDLAVGVIIGGAFGKIVDSMVNDIIMPPIGIFGSKDFTNLYLPLSEKVSAALATNPSLALDEAKKLGPVLAYGNFFTIVLNFTILAFVIFLMIKGINAAKKASEEKEAKEKAATPPPPAPAPPTEVLLAEIRDLLKKSNS